MSSLFVLAAVMAALLTAGVGPALAQPSDELKDLRKDVDALKEGQRAMQSDLQEIKKLLTRTRPAPPPSEAVLSIEGAPSKGLKDAKVTLLEFTDYQ
jgi:hypothetical protein